ncbi:uncharacterized protein LOC129402109 isoform X1 [Sorex araneus]|uniref:uncharacterized protein LOC129402109 isoform X1 n=1 Tax=Sorex araneus TaxID=42254 RepID=UPI002434017E|nr:uncharacterized protein LOC129402109 isoform X1 [Sorex araneus]
MRGDPTLDSAKGKTLSPGTRTSLAKQPDCPLPGREGVSGCRPGGRGGGLHRRDQVSRAPKTAMCPGAAAAARKAGLRNPRGALGPRPRTPRTDPRVGPRCPRWTQEAAVGGRDLRGKAPRCRLKAPECIDSKVTAAQKLKLQGHWKREGPGVGARLQITRLASLRALSSMPSTTNTNRTLGDGDGTPTARHWLCGCSASALPPHHR